MPDSSSLLISPLMSLVALALIALICRWVFGTGRPQAPAAPAQDEDLGLLQPVAEVRTREDAEMLRDLLEQAGVRAGISQGRESVRVLVFGKDLARARELVSAD